MAERLFDSDSGWPNGQQSSVDPGIVPLGQFWEAMNMMNVGGILSCRPGQRCLVHLPNGKLQGAALFRPKLGLEQMIVVIDGVVYAADYPFKNFRQLPNILFSPEAKQMYFAQTEQSAQRTTLAIDSPIEIIQSKNVLFMQDGGATAPAWYDGSNSGHIRDNAFETPTGGAMQWVGDRLWVAQGSSVFASDIANPFSFREQIYLGGKTSFTFQGDVTAMAVVPTLEFPQLLVFTNSTTTLIQASIRERALWLTTNGMSQDILSVGCESQRSLVQHFGQLYWVSNQGTLSLDTAALSKHTGFLPARDNEMMVSKVSLSQDLSLVAGAAYGQFILMSMPSEDQYNKHTWVLNNAALETVAGDSGPSWCGHWMGTRPVQWVYGQIYGSERIYHVSFDEDGGNRLWECFTPDRLDNGCPIVWYVATRGYFGTSSNQKRPNTPCKFCYAEIGVTAVAETLDIAAFFAGGLRGAYKRILTRRVNVSPGSMDSSSDIDVNTDLFAFKPQSRKLRTEEARLLEDTTETGSCDVEDERLENIDESFQILVVGQGPASIRYIRAFAQPYSEDQSAEGEACQDETDLRGVRFDGFAASGQTFDEIREQLAAKPNPRFTSIQTETISYRGVTSTGMGMAESVISQEAADRLAQTIATRQAEFDVLRNLAPTISLGASAE